MKFYENSISHLNNKNMNYMEHFAFSFFISTSLLTASVKSFIHSFIPSIFPTSTTDLKNSLNDLLHD